MKIVNDKLRTSTMEITFHRTLRIPEDGRTYALPPSLGVFPIKRIDDYSDRVPASWREKGGVFIPLYQREALWMSFHSCVWSRPNWSRPSAIKIAVGKVNAMTGEPWRDGLTNSSRIAVRDGKAVEQDYMVCPPQPWLDGIKSADGTVKQFVAMPLGMGYSVEAQVTGQEIHGGIQLAVYPGKRDYFPKPKRSEGAWGQSVSFGNALDCYTEKENLCCASGSMTGSMGIGAGGDIKQKIYLDPHGIDAWDVGAKERVFVHLVNSQMYREITGCEPPSTPITRATYIQKGYPWFDLWDAELGDVGTSSKLSGVKSLSQIDKDKGFGSQQDDTSVPMDKIITVKTPAIAKGTIRDGDW